MIYADLTTELDALLHELEYNADLPLDELTRKVQRAYALIGEGRQHLRVAEEAVTRVMDDFGADDFEEDEADEEQVEPPSEHSDDE